MPAVEYWSWDSQDRNGEEGGIEGTKFTGRKPWRRLSRFGTESQYEVELGGAVVIDGKVRSYSAKRVRA